MFLMLQQGQLFISILPTIRQAVFVSEPLPGLPFSDFGTRLYRVNSIVNCAFPWVEERSTVKTLLLDIPASGTCDLDSRT